MHSETRFAAIASAVDAVKSITIGRNPAPAEARWSVEMLTEARKLAEAIGVPFNTAFKLRPHELIALFFAANRSPQNAIDLAESKRWTDANDVPAPAPMGAPATDLAPLMAQLEAMKSQLDAAEHRVKELELRTARKLEIVMPDKPDVEIDGAHKDFEKVFELCVAGKNPYLVGPAGTGKTTLAMQIAKGFNRQFYMAAKVADEFALMGFISPSMNPEKPGNYVRTPFRDAYEHGGVFLLDEMDASDAAALTAFNAALENGVCPFPDGLVSKHPNFVALGAGNTYGTGADAQYVGRQQIDAATLERFWFVRMDYDSTIEEAISPDKAWLGYVRALRDAAQRLKVLHLFSPRASRNGCDMLAMGWTWEDCAEGAIWKGINSGDRAKLEAVVRMSDYMV